MSGVLVNPFSVQSLRRAGNALLALPRGLVTMVTAAGKGARAPLWRTASAGLLGAIVGLVAWFVALLGALAVVRGPLYGLVDRGPYDDSWGGPSLAGAWIVHALVALPFIPVALWALIGIDALVRGVFRRLLHREGPGWPVPVAILVAIAGGLSFVSWANQLQG